MIGPGAVIGNAVSLCALAIVVGINRYMAYPIVLANSSLQ